MIPIFVINRLSINNSKAYKVSYINLKEPKEMLMQHLHCCAEKLTVDLVPGVTRRSWRARPRTSRPPRWWSCLTPGHTPAPHLHRGQTVQCTVRWKPRIYSLCLVVQRIISELPSSSFYRPTRASSSPSPSAIRTTQAGQNISTRYQYGTGTVSTNAT